jgi:hypothetical protein
MSGYDVKSLLGAPLTWALAVEILRDQGSALANVDEYHLRALSQIFVNNSYLALNFAPDRFQGDMLLFTATIDKSQNVPDPETWKP